MNELLKQKIKQLSQTIGTSCLRIQQALNEREKIESTIQVPRPFYSLEILLKDSLIPNIISPSEIQSFLSMDGVQRELSVKEKFSQKVAAAQTADEKISLVNAALQLQNTKLMLDKLGSQTFSDPYFCQPSRPETIFTEGQNWLEKNGLEMPSEEEILAALRE